MRPSEELLALREECVSILDHYEMAGAIHASSVDAWSYCYRECMREDEPSVRTWVTSPERTHLEVVEMLERAALAAMKSEGET